MGRVFVAGALHLDVVVDAPHIPARDETVVGHRVAYRFGGKGGNQAVAAARMGASVSMAGRVGRDRFGDQLLDALDAAGVERAQVRRGAGASGMSVALVEDGGDYAAAIVSGENREIQAGEIELPDEPFVLLLQNEVPQDVNRALVARARAETCVVLNAAPAMSMPEAVLARVDLLIANRVEAAALVGTVHDGVSAARALLDLGPQNALVSLGGDGVACAGRDGTSLSAAAHAVDVISTHGAGDAFAGACAAALSDGAPLPDAVAFGQAAAALIVSTPPDQRGEIDRAAVAAFLGA